ncbi:MAG: hypothetical protein ACO388_07505 [Saprospiraceae bacterium]
MTTATWNPAALTTVTLPECKWGMIRAALLCIACDERTKGNHADADYWLSAFYALKEAMGD